ncbi:hypothetical protein CRUP_025440 [Coryphaenoides rupestris]|nr:hypothetical protein CRUP_025440 [Coryphaenoides rupestris]
MNNMSLVEPTQEVAYAAVFGCVVLLGLPLNVVSLWILLRRHRLKSPSAVLMINLAFSDLLLVVSLPTRVYFYATGSWLFSAQTCILLTMLFPQQHPHQRHLHHLHRRGPTPCRGLPSEVQAPAHNRQHLESSVIISIISLLRPSLALRRLTEIRLNGFLSQTIWRSKLGQMEGILRVKLRQTSRICIDTTADGE